MNPANDDFVEARSSSFFAMTTTNISVQELGTDTPPPEAKKTENPVNTHDAGVRWISVILRS